MRRIIVLLIIVSSILIACKSQDFDLTNNSLIGKYIGIGKENAGVELRLIENKEFKFWVRKGHSSDFTQGTWITSNDTLILQSKTLNRTDCLTYALSSATWIEFKNTRWKINKRNLNELETEQWKVRKVAE
ncbi:hypothetical protein ACFO5O_05610 [Geojedonia litorea]|uniref:Lipoprotein n=1 Tax=Geojedonia litorea TaxID=1268269 RepID=A0ABV9N2H6_9FLAO